MEWLIANETVLSGIAAVLAISGGALAVGYRLLRVLKARSTSGRTSGDDASDQESADVPPGLGAPAASEKPSIAVLPFLNMSDDKNKEYFADGMTEDLITGLSVGKHLAVKSRTSTFAYKGKSQDIRKVGKELHAKYVVEGSIRPMEDRVRITVQLILAETGDHLWANKYDRPAGELFDIQDDVLSSITSSLGANISRAESFQASSRKPKTLGAWEAVQRAPFFRDIDGNSVEVINESIEELRRATADEPDYAYAHSMLAWLLFMRAINGLSDDRSRDIADGLENLHRGMSLGGDDPYNLYLSASALGYAGQLERSIQLCFRALELDPNFGDVDFALAHAYTFLKRFEEAEAALDRVEKRAAQGSISRYYQWYRGILRFHEQRYEECEQLCRLTIEKAPNYTTPYMFLAFALDAQGRTGAARHVAQRALAINPKLRIQDFHQPNFNPTAEEARQRGEAMARIFGAASEAAGDSGE